MYVFFNPTSGTAATVTVEGTWGAEASLLGDQFAYDASQEVFLWCLDLPNLAGTTGAKPPKFT